MKTFLTAVPNPNNSSSSLGSITSRSSDFNNSSFSLSSQSSNMDNSSKQLWLIRHGERMDEVATKESRDWRFKVSDQRHFDPPLTLNGFQQAKMRGLLLQKELKTIINPDNYPKCIYASPTERTLGTAMEIAICTKLPIVVVPGLSSCAAAVKRGGLIKLNMTKKNKNVINTNSNANNNTNSNAVGTINEQKLCDNLNDLNLDNNSNIQTKDWELFLNFYGWVGKCNFLTKKEIIQKFGTNNGVKISFDYRYIDKFRKCVERLINESDCNTILCVTHREGIRKLDARLKRTRIPYCAVAKYAANKTKSKHNSYQFVYFEDD